MGSSAKWNTANDTIIVDRKEYMHMVAQQAFLEMMIQKAETMEVSDIAAIDRIIRAAAKEKRDYDNGIL